MANWLDGERAKRQKTIGFGFHRIDCGEHLNHSREGQKSKSRVLSHCSRLRRRLFNLLLLIIIQLRNWQFWDLGLGLGAALRPKRCESAERKVFLKANRHTASGSSVQVVLLLPLLKFSSTVKPGSVGSKKLL